MEKAHGPDHLAFAEFLERVSKVYLEKRRLTDAIPFYQRALDVYERAWPYDPNLPMKFQALAQVHYSQHRYAEALLLFERGLALAERAPGHDPFWQLHYLNQLPQLYLTVGRYADAERVVRHVMSRVGERLGSEQQDATTSPFLRRLSGLYMDQGYYDDALSMYQRADRLDERPGQLPVVARRRARELAAIYVAQDRYAEAEEIYAGQLRSVEEGADPAEAEIAAIERKLKALGNPRTPNDFDSNEKARQPLLLELARARARMPAKTELASLLGSLGAVRHRQGRYPEAEALFERAIAVLGERADRGSVIPPMTGLAAVYAEQERYGDAEQLLTRALQLDEEDWRRNGRPPGATSAGILNALGRIARKRRRLPRAEQLHKLALKIVEDLGPDRIDVGTTLVDLGEVYRAQGRHAEAEPFYKRALELCEKGNLSPNHSLVRDALGNLAALYEGQGRSADADRLKRGGPHAELWVR